VERLRVVGLLEPGELLVGEGRQVADEDRVLVHDQVPAQLEPILEDDEVAQPLQAGQTPACGPGRDAQHRGEVGRVEVAVRVAIAGGQATVIARRPRSSRMVGMIPIPTANATDARPVDAASTT
jgi:hypothetical protein